MSSINPSNPGNNPTTTTSASSGTGVVVAGAQPPPPRRRLQPSDKQLKQQHHHQHHQSSSSSSCHHHPQRQKSFGSSSNQTIMAGLYDLEETLGKGHFATVKAAKHVFTGERVAVKVIDKTKLDSVSQKALLKEVLCMKLVQHPNVVKLYEVIDTSSKMYLVLELGQGDLYDLILRQQGGLPEAQARVYFKQILTAVSYCHKLHVAHRDLKPENVVFFPPQSTPSASPIKSCSSSSSSPQQQQQQQKSSSSPQQQSKPVLGRVKLTDFGFSNKFCPGVNLDTSCGSLAYSAPEILLGDSYDAPSVDIWSLGVILYMLACGRAPFQEANDSETLTMIMDVKYSLPDHLSPSLKDLIQRMLVRDPGRRARLHEIETHQWVKEEGGTEFQVDPVDDEEELQDIPLIVSNKLSDHEKERIFSEMVKGGVVSDVDEIRSSLVTNAYNHITSTYYLLAERFLRDKARRPAASSSSTPTAQSPTSSKQSSQCCSSPDQQQPQPQQQQSPPPRIRRKNSHVLEDVVLPSAAAASQHHEKKQTPKKEKTTQNIAGLDLETNSLIKSKFVCLPVMDQSEEAGGGGAGGSSSSRNSSPHHPHYYHHLGKRISSESSSSSSKVEAAPSGSSPPRYCSGARTRINKSHHSHSDSSDEGGGGGVGGAQPPGASTTSSTQQQQPTTIVVTTPTTPDDDEEHEHDQQQQQQQGGLSDHRPVYLKPSPSYEGIVDDSSPSSCSSSGKRSGKKKRVLFLSWFFKRSGGGKVNSGGGGSSSKRGGGGGATTNGIYKTRSCAELKTRGCGNDVELNVRECFGVCNGVAPNTSSSSTTSSSSRNNNQGSVK